MESQDVEWICLVEDEVQSRLVSTVKNFRLQKSTILVFSRKSLLLGVK